MILVVLLYALCASMFTISKWALLYSEPLFFIAVRMIGAATLLGAYLLWAAFYHKRSIKLIPRTRDLGLFAQIVFFHILLTYICDLCALKYISSIESAFIYNLSPFISAFFSYLIFHEQMTMRKWIGLGFGLCAFIPSLLTSQAVTFGLWWPRVVTLVAVISSAYGWILVRELVKDRGYSPLMVNSWGMFIGGLGALGLSLSFEPWQPFPVAQWIPFIQASLLIIVVANLLFYNLYAYLLNYYTATFLSFAGFMCPFFAALFGWLFLGETISLASIFSFILVGIGLYIFYREELRQGYIKE